MRPITLSGFESKFAGDPDPWETFTDRDEAYKRRAILHALGTGRRARMLELAAGNGSNSVALAAHALRLDATEGTAQGTRLVADATAGQRHVRAIQLRLPDRFPRSVYEAIVVAEILYYLSPREMALVARRVAAATRPGARLVLAHHRVDFPDFVQHARHLHAQFLGASGVRWRRLSLTRRRCWLVEGYARV